MSLSEMGETAAPPRREPAIGELLSDLASQTSTLVRQEVKLARAEMMQKAREAARQVELIAAGAVLAVVSLVVLAATAVIALSAVMALWAAALVVGLIIAAVAWALVTKGVAALREIDPLPREALEAFDDTKTWARRQFQ